MKILQNHWLPKKLNFTAITLYPYILLAIDYPTSITSKVLAHEFVHVRQIRQQGFLKFYGMYLWMFIKLYIKFRDRDEAYKSIPVEVEAYSTQATNSLPSNLKVINGVLQEE